MRKGRILEMAPSREGFYHRRSVSWRGGNRGNQSLLRSKGGGDGARATKLGNMKVEKAGSLLERTGRRDGL